MQRVLLLVLLITAQAAIAGPLSPRERAVQILNRFAYGPRPGDVDAVVQTGVDRWFSAQLHPESMDLTQVNQQLSGLSTLSTPPEELARTYVIGKAAADLRARGVVVPLVGDILTELSDQKLVRAVESPAQLDEVMADFWENHFNIDWHKGGADLYTLTDYDQHVIRPNALGHFPDLLKAVAHSAAMMEYLDNARSTRPPDRRHPLGGLNENYARELMELHTLGVRGGYTQRDVIEVARCLTGWTIERPSLTFTFRPALHDNGPKVVLGHRIPPGGGQRDGDMVLDLLAHHPSTSRFIAGELCQRFVSDHPPRALVERVAAVYRQTNGDIRAMLTTIERSPEFWSRAQYRSKIKMPFEMVVSALRATNSQILNGNALMNWLRQMGEGLYSCQPPTGYEDKGVNWVSSAALLQRINFALTLSQGRLDGVTTDLAPLLDRLRMMDPQGHGDPQSVDLLADELLHADVSLGTRTSLESALLTERVDYPKLIGLVLGSPEFQRR